MHIYLLMKDGAVFRFFERFHIHVPKNALPANCAPYLMQDSIRYELHPGKGFGWLPWGYVK